jgi:hypothetical protein
MQSARDAVERTGCGRHAFQFRLESQIRTTDTDRKMREAGDHSRYAKADLHRKCPSAGSTEMDTKPGLTNADTGRLVVLPRSDRSLRRDSIE